MKLLCLLKFRFCRQKLFFLLFISSGVSCLGQAVHVEVKKNDKSEFRLFRDGKEYFVQGGGGSTNWDELAAIGGNSVRTWSADNAKAVLDEAQRLGLTVMMGLWMQHERHGFDYDDQAKVNAQLEGFRKVVMEIKDHPALLLWGVGNEVDLQYTNTNVWKAVNAVAQMIHDVDPHHPTSTVTAGLDEAEVKLILRDCPAIDIYGINTYGDLGNVKKNIRNFGWKKSYLITEWGPNGHWEVQKTSWGAPIEQISSEKAFSYKTRYTEDILGDGQYCMGSYAFLWGQKQETTSTWYGLFSAKGERSPAIDELEILWSKKPLTQHCPDLTSLTINGKKAGDSVKLRSDSLYSASAIVKDLDGDKLKVKWMIILESTDIKSGGDAESAPQAIAALFKSKSASGAKFRAPATEGAYRLFYEVTDGHNHYAYGNFPFYVIPALPGAAPGRPIAFKKQVMR